MVTKQLCFIAICACSFISISPCFYLYRLYLSAIFITVSVCCFIAIFPPPPPPQGYTPNEEGLDQKLAVHYFGRVAFIQELLPLMRGSADARVLRCVSETT
jgi:hypothetical protein